MLGPAHEIVVTMFRCVSGHVTSARQQSSSVRDYTCCLDTAALGQNSAANTDIRAPHILYYEARPDTISSQQISNHSAGVEHFLYNI